MLLKIVNIRIVTNTEISLDATASGIIIVPDK